MAVRHLLFVIHSMGGGGAERVMATLANHFCETRGWRVTILTLHRGDVRYSLHPHVTVRPLRTARFGSGSRRLLAVPLFAIELAWRLWRDRPDAVMSFLVRPNLALLLTRWLGSRRRLVISERCATDAVYHGASPAARLMRRLVGALYPMADEIVAISHGVKASLIRLGVPARRVRVIYNPLATGVLAAADEARDQSAGRPFQVVTAGRFDRQKDFTTLFKAFARLVAMGVDARLAVLGEGPDEARLREQARVLNLEDRVDWKGWLADPHVVIAAGDAFVLTSRWEGFGNVLAEAMACGVPVVSTDCPSGPAEILENGRCGLLVPVGDDVAVAEALHRLAIDPELRADLRAKGRARARDFGVDGIADAYAEVLVGTPASPPQPAATRWRRLLTAIVLIATTEATAQTAFWWRGASLGVVVEPAYSAVLGDRHKDIIQTQVLDASTQYVDYSRELGWTIKPGGQAGLYRSNGAGIRADREYSPRPPAGLVRIVVAGDSYTHGDEVSNAFTWPRLVEQLDARLEVLNLGVGGYGPDQALLRLGIDGWRYRPHVALLGFRPENIHRVVSVFRPFYVPDTGLPLAKPRFTIRDRALVLLPNPLDSRDRYAALLEDDGRVLARLGDHDFHYQRSHHRHWADASAAIRLVRQLAHRATLRATRGDAIEIDGLFNPASEAFEVLLGVVRRFGEDAIAAGARPVFVILPDAADVAAESAGAPRRYLPLLARLAGSAVPTVDAMNAFIDHGLATSVETLFGGHYNEAGNAVVARFIHRELAARGFVPD